MILLSSVCLAAVLTLSGTQRPIDALPIFPEGRFTPRNECFEKILERDGYLADIESRITERSAPGFHRGPLDRWMDRVDMANAELTHQLSQSTDAKERAHIRCMYQGVTRAKELMIQYWTSTVDWLKEYSPNVEVGEEEETDIKTVVELMQWLDEPYEKANKEKSP